MKVLSVLNEIKKILKEWINNEQKNNIKID